MADVTITKKDFDSAGTVFVWANDTKGPTPNWPDKQELAVTKGVGRSAYLTPDGSLTPRGVLAYEKQIRHALLTVDRAAYNIIEVEFDMKKIPEAYRPAVRHIRDAFDDLTLMNWIMRFPRYEEMVREVAAGGDGVAQEHFSVVGPKCQTIDHKLCDSHPGTSLDELALLQSNVVGIVGGLNAPAEGSVQTPAETAGDEKPPVKKVADAIIEQLGPKSEGAMAAIRSPYTAVVPAKEGEDGAIPYKGKWYKAIPYNEHPVLKPHMEKIAGHFALAAEALKGVDEPLGKECAALAKAYTEWKLPLPLEEAHLEWRKTVGGTSPINAIVSVEWMYQGNGKALPSAELLLTATSGTGRVGIITQHFTALNQEAKALFSTDIQQLIPDKADVPTMQFGEVVYAGGDSLAPEYLPGGSQIPNDGSLNESGNSVLTYFQNFYKARQKKESGAIAAETVDPAWRSLATDESDALDAMAHEISHSMLVNDSTPLKDSSRGVILGVTAAAFEEEKGDLLGLRNVIRLWQMGIFDKDLVLATAASMVTNTMRNLYRGYTETAPIEEWDGHFSGAYLGLNILMKHGILNVSVDGVVSLNFDNLVQNIDGVIREIGSPYIAADKEACRRMLSEAMTSLPPSLTAKFEKIRGMRIPTRNVAKFRVIDQK